MVKNRETLHFLGTSTPYELFVKPIDEGVKHRDFIQILICSDKGVMYGILLVHYDGALDWRLPLGDSNSKLEKDAMNLLRQRGNEWGYKNGWGIE
jgi:hypothetical protein